MSEVTQILAAVGQGENHAAEQLLPLVYDELRRLAAARLAREQPGQTLSATALVHEAYLRLVQPGVGSQESGVGRERSEVGGQGSDDGQSDIRPPTSDFRPATFDSRGHFFAAAAEAMRRILVEAARRRQSLKRGGELVRQDIDALDVPLRQPPEEVLAVHEALGKLADLDERAAQLVKLRYFAGFTMKEAAEILGVAPRTADDVWAYARAWLAAEIGQL